MGVSHGNPGLGRVTVYFVIRTVVVCYSLRDAKAGLGQPEFHASLRRACHQRFHRNISAGSFHLAGPLAYIFDRLGNSYQIWKATFLGDARLDLDATFWAMDMCWTRRRLVPGEQRGSEVAWWG